MSKPTIVVGAGLSGLACAVRLYESGTDVLVLEASDGVGGRVRTDEVDGFLLDRGFQVYLDAYPIAGALLDLDALELHSFRSGTLVKTDGKLRRMMDGIRHPEHAIGTALQPIGTFVDKLRVLRLRHRALYGPPLGTDMSTESFLREFGFSKGMIDQFFRSFYGGIFLERELRTSARMFLFTFAMFSKGHATLPANGMGSIPAQLQQRLPPDAIRLNTRVAGVKTGGVSLDSDEFIEADQVIMATGGTDSVKKWRGVTGLYFSANQSPLKEAIIALNGSKDGLVNNVCVPSDVAPNYAPKGKALISVAVLGTPNSIDIERKVSAELESWFGDQVRSWELLKVDQIPHALPEQAPKNTEGNCYCIDDGVYICGDHCSSASIEGAISSGLAVASALV